MSLINRVLRDLDAREASEQERTGLAPGVRTLPTRPARRWPPMLAGLLAAAVVGAGIAWWLSRELPPPPPPAPAPAPALPALNVPLPPTDAPDGEPAVSATAGEEAFALRIDTALNVSSESLPAPQAESPSPPPAAPPTPSPAAPRSSPPAAPVAKVSPVGTASVEPGRTVAPTAEAASAPVTAIAPAPIAPKPDAPKPETMISATPPASEGEGRIERQLRGGLAQEAAESEYRRALALLRRAGAVEETLAALESALTLYPAHAAARQTLLALLVENRQFEQAAAVARAGLAIDAKQSGWAMILARLQVEQGDLAAAAATLASHAAAATANADYAAFRAYLHYRLKETDAAIEHYRMALSLKPQEGRWWYGLGLAYEAAQRADEARAAFRAARDSGTLPAELVRTVEARLK